MSHSPARPRFSAELRASLYHATVFLSNAAAAVGFAAWLGSRGISPDEIGIINAVPVLVLLGINMFIGRIADKASDWRQMLIILSLIGGVVPIGLFVVDEFWGILLVWTLVMIPTGSIPPLVDAATVRLTRRNGSDFGFVRAWGTVGYMVASGFAGWVIAAFGIDAFVPLIVGLTLLRAALALQLPRFRGPAQPVLPDMPPLAGKLREVLRPWFVLPLVGFALINATHTIIVAFVAFVWLGQGIDMGTIGWLIAVGAAAEAIMMFVWRRIGRRFTARHMIFAAGVTVAIRWTIMAFEPSVPVLFVLQLSHAITYGVGYFGMVHFIANWTSEDIAAEAQGFSFVLQQVFAFVTVLSFGGLVGALGAKAFLLAALLGVAGAICVAISLRLRAAHK
ncbi:MFS transporter [Arsenicitalea aurantiaca]|uniref:MFS transporter n=1 Tax=Arsenicitalea aurantiaca TaxID=1783274 RepID=A0A433XGE5_9HYPH|nr:MFS transporter [Arsenicitalea aurantiaca]RUT33155.1 MFS transporter [Arsenicitalea aurantiaca]